MGAQVVRHYRSPLMVTTPAAITDREQTRAVQHQDNILGRAYALINTDNENKREAYLL